MLRAVACLTLVLGLATSIGAVGPQVFNVQSYGATPSDGTDDTTAIQNALNAAALSGYGDFSGGAVVYFPPGVYDLSGQLTLPQRPVTLRGDGMEVSELRWNGTSAGLAGSYTNPYTQSTLTITDLTLSKSSSTGCTAIAVNVSRQPAPVHQPVLRAQNLIIRPHGPTGTGIGWSNGITCSNCFYSSFTDINIRSDLQYGIYMDGVGTDTSMRNISIWGGSATTGIRAYATTNNDMQGLKMTHVTVGASKTGISVDAVNSTPVWLSITDSTVTASDTGIFLQNRNQSTLRGNLIYRADGGSSTFNFVGIYLQGGQDSRVNDNQIYVMGPSPSPGYAYYGAIGNHSDGTFTGNIFVYPTYGIWIPAGNSGWTISANRGRSVAATVADSGSGNVVTGNN